MLLTCFFSATILFGIFCGTLEIFLRIEMNFALVRQVCKLPGQDFVQKQMRIYTEGFGK
jgi:hypothetical protein